MLVFILNAGSSSLKYQLMNPVIKKVFATGICERIGIDGVLKHEYSVNNIDAIGHRVAHGGETFKKSTLVTDKVIKEIERLIPLAPIHNPANILGIKICQELMPGKPNVTVFDTVFHQTMPDYAYMYALPYDQYTKHGIRKYGFHGTSHYYVSNEARQMLDKKHNTRIIVCHLGNGSSVTAVLNGKSIDTSMGLTPVQGRR